MRVEIGDRREVWRFALLPWILGGDWVCLRWILWHEIYKQTWLGKRWVKDAGELPPRDAAM